MGNKALRTRLSNLLKQDKVGTKLYTKNIPKRKAWRHLQAYDLRNMIAFLENVKPGMKLHEWGVNQEVSEPVEFATLGVRRSCKKGTYFGGNVIYKADQLKYKSGMYGCGCGSYDCNVDSRLRTKEQIVTKFLQNLYSEWGPSYLAQDYFKLLEKGIDILTEDGFFVDNHNELRKDLR
jgi:hypothetical protein